MEPEEFSIDGQNYVWAINGKKSLMSRSYTTLLQNKKPDKIKVPSFWVVTRNNGNLLFILRKTEEDETAHEGYIRTAAEIYDMKFQWFEPLADNYRELLWVNQKEYIKPAYKWFTWEEIKEAACEKRPPASYASYMPGDWKRASGGADGFLLVMIDRLPYWADAVGQLPFAVGIYRFKRNLEKVIRIGMEYATGLPGPVDTSNEYDNFFILRGALFAKKMYSFKVEISGLLVPTEDVTEIITDISARELGNPITSGELANYGFWNK
ncbi:hypothetical protein [Halodesulfovibrio sp.]|jgi:hypothetical protein|uniref:hypothetical protein n=1 Tax=Halodesulfovibrio sp. TaxID=1912772 RepID=UPI0025D13EB7|nr:hypothetical protein [Halodesulfovibrio sp.]MCT4535171.1 hypothetical protein [Halodesulfovibrio sp.]